MNYWDIIITAVIVSVVILAIIKIVKNKKQGKTNCGGDCSQCGGCTSSKRDV